MIDLHAHTTASDGTTTPAGLIETTLAIGLEALAIADHDTFAGYDEALPLARQAAVDLVCSIELSTRMPQPKPLRPKSVHLLGYFLSTPPSGSFREWIDSLHASRRERNTRMAERLRQLGLDVRREEAEALAHNPKLTGRPHFARLLVRKGYVSDIQEAFDVYLAESAPAYVPRREPRVPEGIRRIREAGGLPVLAHPLRLGNGHPLEEKDAIRGMVGEGLRGIEVYHPDHSPQHVQRYLGLAETYGLLVTGGSDFHGDTKPGVLLGVGTGNLCVPLAVLDRLRASDGC